MIGENHHDAFVDNLHPAGRVAGQSCCGCSWFGCEHVKLVPYVGSQEAAALETFSFGRDEGVRAAPREVFEVKGHLVLLVVICPGADVLVRLDLKGRGGVQTRGRVAQCQRGSKRFFCNRNLAQSDGILVGWRVTHTNDGPCRSVSLNPLHSSLKSWRHVVGSQ